MKLFGTIADDKNIRGSVIMFPSITSGSSLLSHIARPFEIPENPSDRRNTITRLKKAPLTPETVAQKIIAIIIIIRHCTITVTAVCMTLLITIATLDTGVTIIFSTVPKFISRRRLTPDHDVPKSTDDGYT